MSAAYTQALEALELVARVDEVRGGVFVLDEQDMAFVRKAVQALRKEPSATSMGEELAREEGWIPIRNGVVDDYFMPGGIDLPKLAYGWEWTCVVRVLYGLSLATPTPSHKEAP